MVLSADAMWKLVYVKGVDGPIWRLFDMIADPHQQNDLSGKGGRVLEEMSRRLMNWIETGAEEPWPRALDDL